MSSTLPLGRGRLVCDWIVPLRHVLDAGVQTAYSDVVINGFRYVWHAGEDGWFYDEYIDLFGTGDSLYVEPGVTLTTTSDLNLREEPNMAANVILVMPEGASVITGDAQVNGFFLVTYNGTM